MMNRELIEVGMRMLGAVVEELALPPDLKAALARIAEEVGKFVATTTPRGPTAIDELSAHSQRAVLNVSGIAALVAQAGADAGQVQEVIRGYLLHQAMDEADVVRALLRLPLAAKAEQESVH
jgi:hypothetical protein